MEVTHTHSLGNLQSVLDVTTKCTDTSKTALVHDKKISYLYISIKSTCSCYKCVYLNELCPLHATTCPSYKNDFTVNLTSLVLLFGVDVNQSTTNSQIKVYATISAVVQFLHMFVMARSK